MSPPDPLPARAEPSLPAIGAEVLIDDVSKTYDGRIRALVDVSLQIRPGEFVVLTGPSGSGKSTLLNIVGSLDKPDAGRVVVDGLSVAELDDPAGYRRDTVGFVFQLHHLLPFLTAEGNVEVPLIATRMHARERRERSRELLDAVGLGGRLTHLPAELSGGERQRVAVARALVNHPRLLLADEPTGSLDSDSSERLLKLFAALQDQHGMTTLMVSYDPAHGRYADRIVQMVDGQISEPTAPV